MFKILLGQKFKVTKMLLFYSSFQYDVHPHFSGTCPWPQYGAPCVHSVFVIRLSSHRSSVLHDKQKNTLLSFAIKFMRLDQKHVGLAWQASQFLCCVRSRLKNQKALTQYFLFTQVRLSEIPILPFDVR